MPWPTSQDYNEAVQNPRTSFTDEELRGGQATANALGVPLPRSGNFADVYEFTGISGDKWALKCFTREVSGLQDRYQEISLCLQKAKFPFTVDFQYLAQGIRIRGQWYPILKMHWVEGLLLNEFVRDNLDKPKTIEGLSEVWLRMARRLREAGVAHADLQHGNVILVPGSKATSLAVKLIDYDGMYVPALAAKPSGEVGHPNYQHPERLRKAIYNADVDRSPLLVVTCALRALLVAGKALWDRFDNGDNLLFREEDLRRPAASPLFQELWNIHDAVLHDLVGHLTLGLAATLDRVPHIGDVIQSDASLPLLPAQEEWLAAQLGPGAMKRSAAAAPFPSQTLPAGAASPRLGRMEPERASELFTDLETSSPFRKKKTQRATSSAAPFRDKKPSNILLDKRAIVLGGAVAAAVMLVVTLLVLKLSSPPRGSSTELAQNAANLQKQLISPLPDSDSDAAPNIDPASKNDPGDASPNLETPASDPLAPKRDPESKRDPEPKRNPEPAPKNDTAWEVPEPLVKPGPRLAVFTQCQLLSAPDNEPVFGLASTNKLKELLLHSTRFRLWDPRTSESRVLAFSKLPKTGNSAARMSVSSDGAKCYLVMPGDSVINVCSLRTLKPLATLVGHTTTIYDFALTPDGKTLISSSFDGTVRVWDTQKAKPVDRLLDGKKGTYASLAVSPDGGKVFASTFQKSFLWDLAGRKELASASGSFVRFALFSPDGSKIIGSTSNALAVQNSNTLARESSSLNHAGVSGACFTRDGNRLLSFGSDHMLRLWDWNTKKLVRVYAGHTHPITSAVCSADGKWIYSCGAGERAVRRWPMDDRSAADMKAAPKADTPQFVQETGRLGGFFSNLIVLPGSGKLLIGGSGIKIWDPAAGVSRSLPQKIFRGGPFTATLAPSPDGSKLFSASWGDADITVWDLATATVEAKLTGHKGNIVRLELTPDGNTLVSVGSDGTIRVWEANKLTESRVLHSDKTTASPALAFSPDSKRVLACCNNKLYLWDLRSGDEIATKQGNHLFAAKFAPDGSHIVGANFSSLQVLNPQSLKVETTYTDHPQVTGLLFSPTGKSLITFGRDNMLRLWDWQAKTVTRVFIGHEGMVSAAACSADGKWLYSCSNMDQTLRQWPLE